MIKNIFFGVMSLLFVTMVSGCGDSEPSPQENLKPAKVEQWLDKKTSEQMRVFVLDMQIEILSEEIRKDKFPENLSDIYSLMTSTQHEEQNVWRRKQIKKMQEDGFKVEYVRDGKNFLITVFSPDGKYKMVHNESEGTGAKLEKVK